MWSGIQKLLPVLRYKTRLQESGGVAVSVGHPPRSPAGAPLVHRKAGDARVHANTQTCPAAPPAAWAQPGTPVLSTLHMPFEYAVPSARCPSPLRPPDKLPRMPGRGVPCTCCEDSRPCLPLDDPSKVDSCSSPSPHPAVSLSIARSASKDSVQLLMNPVSPPGMRVQMEEDPDLVFNRGFPCAEPVLVHGKCIPFYGCRNSFPPTVPEQHK